MKLTLQVGENISDLIPASICDGYWAVSGFSRSSNILFLMTVLLYFFS
jgi:hypothetical protein